ncbi:Zn-ribbon domain-containing OB-fold protein [Amycolatopsis taiwanensis]|uniref:DNA-binding protein n=1 Tax=Amycolatopsis taiwanensis TaxID=342230 RepID=A0A9W6R9B0_9PSEU|nr:OB-fold nucleic acid binding domain-containing protein [Amycolatopsis taiwanensis]GLY69790.1 DNA-binding protein [Amycolatopsis taiwanensis]
MRTPLSAPLEISFDYTRSLGPVLGRFVTGLRDRRIEGVRGSDGGVHVPPVEYDPVTAQPLGEFVPVGEEGTVLSWSWTAGPLEGQPLAHPFAWALIQLDGADTAMLHAVDVSSPEEIHTGMRVRVRWADERVGHIRDIACFVPADAPGEPSEETAGNEGGAVSIMVTPVRLSYQHSVSPEESRFLRGLADGRLIGQRCPACRKVYVPPRGACPTDGVPTEEEVELPDTGIVTTFCIVNVPFLGQRIKPPYVAAYILLDGADIAFLHLVLGCDASEVRMGMRVRAAWKPREEWWTSLENIDHFEPTGEPDAPYESFAHHL